MLLRWNTVSGWVPDPNSLKCNNALSLNGGDEDDDVRTKDLVSELGLFVGPSRPRVRPPAMRILIDLGPRQKEREVQRRDGQRERGAGSAPVASL